MSCEVLCTLSSLLNMIFQYPRGMSTLHSCWTPEPWLSSFLAEPAWVRTAMSRVQQRVTQSLPCVPALGSTAAGELTGSSGKPGCSANTSILKGSRLSLRACDGFKLRFASPKFPAPFPISILLTVTDRRMKRWIFSWPVLKLPRHNCGTRVSESVSHLYLPRSSTMVCLDYYIYFIYQFAFQKYLSCSWMSLFLKGTLYFLHH